MATEKISIEVISDPLRAGIILKSIPTGVNASDIDKVVVYRQVFGTAIWNTIFEFDIEDVSELNFELLDILALGGEKYNYSIDLMADGSILPVQSYILDNKDPITREPKGYECWFEGMLIGNFETQYLVPLDWQVDYDRNTSVEYVNTLAGRTPYRVSNSENNYDTGSASGLFVPIIDGRPTPENSHAYHKEVINFLSDGTEKILKTSDGQIWCISVDDAITVPFDDRFKGRNMIEFNWTEIGDVPPFGMVKL